MLGNATRHASRPRDRHPRAQASKGARLLCATVLSALASASLAAPAEARPSPPPRACGSDRQAPDVALGPPQAPRTLRAWIDPLDPMALLTYVELRRLAADTQGTLRVEISLTRGGNRPQPPYDRARAWAIALGRHGHLESALRELARDGPDRLAARLTTPTARALLAADLSLSVQRHEQLATDPCAQGRLVHSTARLREHYDDNAASVRPPVFEVDGIVFDDVPTLGRVRPQLARPAVSEHESSAQPAALPAGAQQPGMRRPALGGILLGGPGLPHRFVLQARDELDASLFMRLPTILRVRRANPGRLAVQVVARGSSLLASALRQRLCAARILGREVSYLEVLASDPAAREHPSPDVSALLAALDQIPDRACKDETDPAQLDLPDGQWLDGWPRARAELANLEITLGLVRRGAYRPLSPWLGKPSDE